MQIAIGIALLGTLVTGKALLFGFAAGDLAKEGGDLLSMLWGIISLVDLYVGFVLFSGWIVFGENSLTRSPPWVVLVSVPGFFTASLYTFVALPISGAVLERF